MAVGDLQAQADAAVQSAYDEGRADGYATAVTDFFGQNAAFLLTNIFADALEGAAARMAPHDAGFAQKMHGFAKLMRGSITQPSVSSTTPANGATSQPAGTVFVKFDEDMDPTTITDGSFIVFDVTQSEPLAFTASFDGHSRTATLTVTGTPASGDEVTVTVAATAKNTQGVAMGTPYSFSFTAA